MLIYVAEELARTENPDAFGKRVRKRMKADPVRVRG